MNATSPATGKVEAVLTLLKRNGWKDCGWTEDLLLGLRAEIPSSVTASKAVDCFPEFGLSGDAVRVAWDLYTEYGMCSSELTPSRAELPFVFALFGLRKAFRNEKTLTCHETWANAMDDGAKSVESLLRNDI